MAETGCPDVGWRVGGMALDCSVGWSRWIRRPVYHKDPAAWFVVSSSAAAFLCEGH